jgi:hypothetical protein
MLDFERQADWKVRYGELPDAVAHPGAKPQKGEMESDVSFLAAGNSSFIKSLRVRLAFVLISKIYRQMYADTGNRHRQCPSLSIHALGPLDGKTLSNGCLQLLAASGRS